MGRTRTGFATCSQPLRAITSSGLGDQSKPVADPDPIVVSPIASEEAAEVLSKHPEVADHIARTLRLLDGFDSEYGTELLATVDWVVRRSASPDFRERNVRRPRLESSQVSNVHREAGRGGSGSIEGRGSRRSLNRESQRRDNWRTPEIPDT